MYMSVNIYVKTATASFAKQYVHWPSFDVHAGVIHGSHPHVQLNEGNKPSHSGTSHPMAFGLTNDTI